MTTFQKTNSVKKRKKRLKNRRKKKKQESNSYTFVMNINAHIP